MAKLEITLDATLLIKAYNQGLQDAFVLLTDYDKLESELNVNQIELPDE